MPCRFLAAFCFLLKYVFLSSFVSVSASIYSSSLRLTLYTHTHTQTRGLFKPTLVYNTQEMRLRCEVCKVVCKVYFTFWKRGEKVGNNPINILRLPDLHVHLLCGACCGLIGRRACDRARRVAILQQA